MPYLVGRNNAVSENGFMVNSQGVDIHQTVRGSDWYWAVTAIMAAAALVFAGLSIKQPRTNRTFHYLSTGICLVAALAYFTMASNLGWTPIDVEFTRTDHRVSGRSRQIFYVRYIDWFITTPLLLMDLLLTAGVPWPTILFVILLDEVMIVTGLVGALVQSSYKWGYFIFGCAALVYVLYVLVFEARKNALRLGTDVHRVYTMCGALFAGMWVLYPIAWGVSEGGNVISPDSEGVFYGILDVIAKVVFSGLLIFGHRNIDPARLGLTIRDFAAPNPVVAPHDEKAAGHTAATTHATSTNGTHDTTVAPATTSAV
jgi:bacteriorhodopsin